MFSLNNLRVKGSALAQIDIIDIKDGIIQLKGGRYRSILQTTSINFELKSEEERDAIIDIYEGFLNSINFPLQFLIRTRELDVEDYINKLNLKLKRETQLIYKQQLKNNRAFIKSLILDNKILSRQFYVVIGFDVNKEEQHVIVGEQLDIRSDIVAKSLSRLGIICHKLDSIEIIDLFYNFYNPQMSKVQPVTDMALNTSLVITGGNR